MPERDLGPQVFWSPDKPTSSAGDGSVEGVEQVRPEDELVRITELAEQVPLSRVRLSHLLKAGKIEGELGSREGGGRAWYTSRSAVEEYLEWRRTEGSFQAWGRKGGLTAGRGRPKSGKARG